MRASYGDEYDFIESVYVLRDQIRDVQNGDMKGIEAMLVGQAHALQQVFVALMRRAGNQDHLKQYQAHMNLGLKAQAQCRATIQALAELKYPRQVVIAKQANIAGGNQRVNNDNGQNTARAPAPENVIEQNELLEHSHANPVPQRLDARAKATAGRDDSEVATVGEIDRSEDLRR